MRKTNATDGSVLNTSTEEIIFHRAHSLSDLAARREYLDVACNGDDARRHRIESLLETAEHVGSFLDAPAVNDVVADLSRPAEFRSEIAAQAPAPRDGMEAPAVSSQTGWQHRETIFDNTIGRTGEPRTGSLIGQTLGHYRVLSLLGSGGMGQVYLAEDLRLCRKVALKIIASCWFSDRQLRLLREAQLASAPDHPNVCAIYDVGESSGHCYIVMQYVDGQTLEKLIGDQPIAVDVLLTISIQVADALAAAHQRGIIHRDIKSRNIMITARGQAIILDFGLAQSFAPEQAYSVRIGGVVGTPAFMSPEQARGEGVDCRSDIFSFGAVLYHMATGTVPFRGSTSADVMRAVIAKPHTPPRELNPTLPRQLVRVVDRALSKSPEDRCPSAEEMASDLRSIQTELSLPNHPASITARRQRRQTLAAVAAALVMGAAGWLAWQWANLNWARQQLPAIESLARAGQTFAAYDLAKRVRNYDPGNVELTRLLGVISSTLTVRSEPSGARVYLSRFDSNYSGGASPSRRFADTTPLSKFEIARGDYVVSVEKEGYVPFRRTYSDRAYGTVDAPITHPSVPLEIKLTPIADDREGMVLVRGGNYRLAATRRPTDELVKLDDYWIDKCEVSNREFKEFVDAGGYRNERYWTHEFVKDGRPLSRAEATRELVDSTNLPGPRHWSNQTFPEGQADHPVVGITWYEAAAYAAYRGKSLPTIFQWEYAARFKWELLRGSSFNNPFGVTMPWGLHHEGWTIGRANFSGDGTVPVGSFEFGMSPCGCYDMAGNVAEWCLNNTSEGFIASGGSWASIPSAWGFFGIYPGFRSSDEVGFRCVVNSPGATGDQGAKSIDLCDEVPHYTPAPEAEVRKLLAHYNYDIAVPLDARVIDLVETNEWWRESIEYRGANGERAFAYLYLPKHFPAPHQVIHILPAGSVTYRQRTVPQLIEAEYREFIRAGRAVFAVVLRGYLGRERPIGWADPDSDDVEYVEMMADHVVDLRRGLDYLRSRSDLDPERIAYLSASHGGILMALPATEPRYGAAIFVGDGVGKWDLRGHSAVSGINFAPLIDGPKLLVHGLYDESAPLKTVAEPLFELLQQPKNLRVYDGAHKPDSTYLVPTVNKWLDGTFGPVQPVDLK